MVLSAHLIQLTTATLALCQIVVRLV